MPDAPGPHAAIAPDHGAGDPRRDRFGTVPEPPADAPRELIRPGAVLGGRYEVRTLIASGGMAEVWEGLDQVLQRPVAVKVLHPHLAADDTFRLRFRAEAIAAARLRHPSIIAIFDTCTDRGTEAIVMELLHGRTLREFLDERGRLDPAEVVDVGADVADALQVAHAAGVVHRDIKPANILLCDDGRVVVTDFGIAKVRDAGDLTTTGIMLGTVKYLAPEQVASEPVEPATDQYSLGVVLYEALCGEPPFQGENPAATALARLHHDPPRVSTRRPEIPAGLDDAVARAMARRPEDRFASAADLRAALLAAPRTAPRPAPVADPTVAADLTVATVAPPPPITTVPATRVPATDAPTGDAGTGPGRRRRWVLPVVVALVVVAALAVAVALVSRTRAGDDLLAGIEPEPTTTPVSLTAARAFDPVGGDGENDELAPAAIDGDPATAWRTERYDSRSFGNLKPGVGLAVQLDRPAALDSLTVRSPSRGWAVQVYVSDAPGAALADWGDPVTTATDLDGDARIVLDGAEGRWVLLWITDLGDGPGRVELAEITLEA